MICSTIRDVCDDLVERGHNVAQQHTSHRGVYGRCGKSSIRIAWLPSLLEHRCVPLFLRRDEFVLRSADLRLKQFGADGQAEVASERV